MGNDRNNTGNSDKRNTTGGAQGGSLDSREGDPRKQDQQDVRTAGPTSDRAKDDPSRAPESGTP